MKNNTNELFRNLRQCMRDTGTYNEKNLETAKKLQNAFESAEKDTGYNLWKKRLASKKGVSCIFAGGFILLVALVFNPTPTMSPFRISNEVACLLGATTVVGTPLLVAYNDKQAQLVDIQKRKRKKAVALDIKDFVDTLRKKNK